jgi:hypothetical protein
MRRLLAATVTAALIAGGSAAPAGGTPTAEFPYQPLWPFADQAAADTWLQDGRSAGESLWHADPAATALKFTREFLGFTDLDRTTTANVQPREAWIGVGQADPRGQPLTVATLHLARLGPAVDAPWEVVGTEDTDLTLDTPVYGSPVQPLLTVGGTISGVDESLHVQARQLAGLIGEFCCLPAGGQRSPWSAVVPISPVQPGAVTVVVSTGGHYANIERFAITGLQSN